MRYILYLLLASCVLCGEPPTDNVFYILLSSSKFFFNYRHTGNTLALYHHLKRMGVTDDRIILMLPENHACNARNAFPGTLHFEVETRENLYCDDIEIDYKGDDLTFESILNLFRGRYEAGLPQHRRLQANERLFVYLNGHGGENFFKIQDTEVVHSEDFAKVFRELAHKGLYSEALIILDTCEALSLFDQVDAPNIVMMGTSVTGQHALSNQIDGQINTYLNDKFTYYLYQYLKQWTEGVTPNKKVTMAEFPSLFPFDKIHSDLRIKSTHKVKTLD
jgi:phosphatidylinositol glycan class K